MHHGTGAIAPHIALANNMQIMNAWIEVGIFMTHINPINPEMLFIKLKLIWAKWHEAWVSSKTYASLGEYSSCSKFCRPARRKHLRGTTCQSQLRTSDAPHGSQHTEPKMHQTSLDGSWNIVNVLEHQLYNYALCNDCLDQLWYLTLVIWLAPVLSDNY